MVKCVREWTRWTNDYLDFKELKTISFFFHPSWKTFKFQQIIDILLQNELKMFL